MRVVIGGRLWLLALGAWGIGGCVLPRFELSGAELSWFAAETNTVDGDEAVHVRSCRGSLITNVEFSITDDGDEDRSKQFTWSCDEGFRTPAQFFTGASDVFVDLAPGNYRMGVRSADDPSLRGADGEVLTVSEDVDVVAIGSDDATLIQWELHPRPIDLELELAGTGECTRLTATLVYTDPQATLPDLDSVPEQSLVYRSALVSEGGLALGGTDTACASLQDGPDRVLGVDRGVYVLIVQIEGQPACSIDVLVDGREGPLKLDLGDLPC